MNHNRIYDIIAILVVAVWGTTFICTKILIQYGLSPQEIFFYRFLVAYIGMWFIAGKRMFASSLKDELLLAAAGLTGGSLYFYTENTALGITQASNVAFLLCITPLITALLTKLFYKGEKLSSSLMWGSLVALAGVALVVFDGVKELKVSPVGDLLTLAAAFSWGFYSIIIRRLEKGYSSAFITRKVFFYGMVTISPVFIFEPMNLQHLFSASLEVWLNLAFLAVVASLACFALWNVVLKKIGTIRATNYVYLSPVVTLAVSSMVLGERMSAVALAGAAAIMLGVWIAGRKK